MRAIFKYLRLTILLILLLCTIHLWHLSHTNDPRFYRFTHSPAGHAIARVMHWYPHQSAIPLHKAESKMTPEERAMKDHLERHAFLHTPESHAPAGISYRDIRFKMEHPDLRMYRYPPYSIMSDESPDTVRDYITKLNVLHERFNELFASLISEEDRRDSIQVLFFSNHQRFAEYQRRIAPNLGDSAGFYSPYLDRFILYNQASHYPLLKADPVSAERATRLTGSSAPPPPFWSADIKNKISQDAQRETSQTLRHEGAHQLFHAYGIHSDIRAENNWLLEGLAAYCETVYPGGRLPDYTAELHLRRERDDLINLEELLANRSLKGFFEYDHAKKTQLAYAQSWSLIHMLMQPAYRENFFAYIRFIRDRHHTGEIVRKQRIEILAHFLEMNPQALQKTWQEYLASL